MILQDRPLLLADPSADPGRLLTRIEWSEGESRRDELAALARWSRSAPLAAAVLPAADRLHGAFRALGFEDAGPLARYVAPTAPGAWRRAARWLFAPHFRKPPGATASPEVLDAGEQAALRERHRSRFAALAAGGTEGGAEGVTVRVDGAPAAFARFGGETEVAEWFAPPDDPDLVGFLAREAARRAGDLGIRRLAFETPHRRIGHGLVLGGFLPGRSRARVLVRDEGGIAGRPPSAASFGLHDVLEFGPATSVGAAIV